MKFGTVKWFNQEKGFGFITCDSDSTCNSENTCNSESSCNSESLEVFVHYSDIKFSGFKNLKEGDKVSFSLVDNEAGNTEKKAVDVLLLSS